MKQIHLDKIASVVGDCNLASDVRIVPDIPCREGTVIAVRVLTDKTVYNQVELPTGRMAELKSGDVLAGALGHRKALFGYSGHLPESLAPGDNIDVLNLGGVLGICDSVNGNFGAPFSCEVLGSILDFPYVGERIGVPATVGKWKMLSPSQLNTTVPPVVAIAGTCMNSGKTTVAASVIKHLVNAGLQVAACKATGVSLKRDVFAMADAGAVATATFTDFGVVATTEDAGPPVAANLLSHLAANRKVDVIVMELGDGILGAYGVDAILKDKYVADHIACLLLAANDPVGAWGAVNLLREQFDLEPSVVTGPATDNRVGTDLIENLLGVAAWNVRDNPVELGDAVLNQIGLVAPGRSAESKTISTA